MRTAPQRTLRFGDFTSASSPPCAPTSLFFQMSVSASSWSLPPNDATRFATTSPSAALRSSASALPYERSAACRLCRAQSTSPSARCAPASAGWARTAARASATVFGAKSSRSASGTPSVATYAPAATASTTTAPRVAARSGLRLRHAPNRMAWIVRNAFTRASAFPPVAADVRAGSGGGRLASVLEASGFFMGSGTASSSSMSRDRGTDGEGRCQGRAAATSAERPARERPAGARVSREPSGVGPDAGVLPT